MARPITPAVFLPYVVGKPLAKYEVALAVWTGRDHSECAFVYALVYSAAPEFYWFTK
jgi:hypothetical protein